MEVNMQELWFKRWRGVENHCLGTWCTTVAVILQYVGYRYLVHLALWVIEIQILYIVTVLELFS